MNKSNIAVVFWHNHDFVTFRLPPLTQCGIKWIHELLADVSVITKDPAHTWPACFDCRSVSRGISSSSEQPGWDQAAWRLRRPRGSWAGHTQHAQLNSSRSTGRRNTHSPLGGVRGEERSVDEVVGSNVNSKKGQTFRISWQMRPLQARWTIEYMRGTRGCKKCSGQLAVCRDVFDLFDHIDLPPNCWRDSSVT